MDKLDNLISVISDQLLKLAQTHGEQAAQLGMLVFQIPYMQGLLTGFGCLVIVLLGFPGSIWAIKKSIRYNDDDNLLTIPFGVGGIISCIASFFCLIGVFTNLFVIAHWLGAFNGPAAVAMTLAKSLTK